MATIKEVAERAKVSVATVSHVISGSVPVSPRLRKRVMAAVRDLDYQPNHVARSLKTKQTMTLGMVISDITNPFFPSVVRGAEDMASKHGYLLITFNTDDDFERERQVLSVLRSRRIDGALLVPAPHPGDVSNVENILAAGIPIVGLDRVPPEFSLDSVSVENEIGARELVRHLVAMGHHDIAALTGPLSLVNTQERLRGYEEALREANIPVRPELIWKGDFRTAGGYAAGRELLNSKKRPTALFVMNGMMTLGVLDAMEELGLRCPDDLAIATFDELPFIRPHLTCAAQPVYDIGAKGAELLIRRIERKLENETPVRLRLRTELKIRESSLGFKWNK